MRIFTVLEANQYIKDLLERDYLLANIWIKGEVSNCKKAVSGHLYFTLKDEASCLKVVMFRSRFRQICFSLENGLAVLVRGYLSVFERDGLYQLYAEEMEPYGVGALQVALEQLKEKLQKEGLFEQKFKKPLPRLPLVVGVVTSPDGAAVQDIIGIMKRRWPAVKIILVPVAVQGETAPLEISRGIEYLNRIGGVDVIIVGRGGGSLEELWAFNTEIVARSIFVSKIPVVSAVGHEKDFSISDLVADLRAATPSAAAELVVPEKYILKRELTDLKRRMINAMAGHLASYQRRYEKCIEQRAFQRPYDFFCGERQQILDLSLRRLEQSAKEKLAAARSKLAVLAGRLQALSPLATLTRGYSICTMRGESKIISRAGEVKKGERVDVQLHQGCLLCMVEETIEKDFLRNYEEVK